MNESQQPPTEHVPPPKTLGTHPHKKEQGDADSPQIPIEQRSAPSFWSRELKILLGIIGGILLVASIGVITTLLQPKRHTKMPPPETTTEPIPQSTNTTRATTTVTTEKPTTQNASTQRTAFKNRVAYKPFGIRINPNTSPVQPERFSGYHTGIDIEFEDISEPVPVYAIQDGTVVQSGYVQGYGGVIIVNHTDATAPSSQSILALYGHLDPESITPNTNVTQGQQLGVLGEGFTQETDGERKHLHFGLINAETVNLRGYVQNKEALLNWIDPLPFLEELVESNAGTLPVVATAFPEPNL